MAFPAPLRDKPRPLPPPSTEASRSFFCIQPKLSPFCLPPEEVAAAVVPLLSPRSVFFFLSALPLLPFHSITQ